MRLGLMASESGDGHGFSEYIAHHLQHLASGKQTALFDSSIVHWDTLFFSLLCAAVSLYFLRKAAKRATSGVPGKFQCAVEMLVEMINVNRKLLETYAAGRSVLNMFCYTGGFSVYALRGGAKEVHSVDSSAGAISLTNENVALNFENDNRHEAIVADGFEYLKNIRNKYDLIILDPPAFTKHRNALQQALNGYKRINTRLYLFEGTGVDPFVSV